MSIPRNHHEKHSRSILVSCNISMIIIQPIISPRPSYPNFLSCPQLILMTLLGGTVGRVKKNISGKLAVKDNLRILCSIVNPKKTDSKWPDDVVLIAWEILRMPSITFIPKSPTLPNSCLHNSQEKMSTPKNSEGVRWSPLIVPPQI